MSIRIPKTSRRVGVHQSIPKPKKLKLIKATKFPKLPKLPKLKKY
jgi:hypothetical protein